MLQCQTHRTYLEDFAKTGMPIEIMDLAYPTFDEAAILSAYKGLNVQSMHAAFIDVNFASNDTDIKFLSQRRIIRSINAGLKLGIKNVVVHTCFYPVLKNASLYTVWCELAAEFLEKLVREYRVNVFVENTLDIAPDTLHELMELVDNTHIKVCLDVGHARLSKKPLSKWFAELYPYIGYMHINDNEGYVDDHLPVGDGVINWSEIKGLLRKYSLDPITTIEVLTPEAFTKSLNYWNSIKGVNL